LISNCQNYFLFCEGWEKLMVDKKNKRNYRSNWQREVDGTVLYRTLSEIEKQPELASVYRKMADNEEKHTLYWEKKLHGAGVKNIQRKLSWRSKILNLLAKKFGAGFILPTLTTNEQLTSSEYDSQAGSDIGWMSADEKSHARLLSAVAGQHARLLSAVAGQVDGMPGGDIAQMEGRHRNSGGNALRAAVLGANDGLVSILSLTMGAAGANLPGKGVLITGIAGLLAGAGSMALGEWLSVQSSRELYQRQIAIEEEEISTHPEDEKEELALIYEAKGLPKKRAMEMATQISSNKKHFIDALSREELGINPKEMGGSPWVAAYTSFLLFAFGAFIPLFPYIFFQGSTAIILSLSLGALALFMTGAAITLMTGKNIWISGFRQVFVGLIAAALVFGVGRLIGVTISG
jgi:vacuolar iron transporter family protein